MPYLYDLDASQLYRFSHVHALTIEQDTLGLKEANWLVYEEADEV